MMENVHIMCMYNAYNYRDCIYILETCIGTVGTIVGNAQETQESFAICHMRRNQQPTL